ncbi:MAG: hypothetical protein B7Y86_11215 [Brevundimonas subvibrioides]|uniref:Uncharacterized protein n=1 Tax=Brevundimonas subvibrioides TaxID=74313 RepID=A0A258HGB0_9CAUL|nr:hypothetical protein [Brevundimonas subvibrioides]OYX56010.1 MAG: hypothetical protein B7Y86_11215 [Brevundimonas subvibrioides]
MLSLKTCAAVADALHDTTLDRGLRDLLRLRARQLHAGLKSHPWFFVIQGGDTPEVINDALGFNLTGDHAEPASCDWIQDHGFWFEIAYGHTRIFVENGPGTELGLHYACLSCFWTDADERRA